MIRWLLILSLCTCQYTNAQNRVETYLEAWSTLENNTDNEQEFIDILQTYDAIDFSTHDFYTLEKWYEFFFLNEYEIEQIHEYLRTHPNETSILFLNTLTGFSAEKAYLIRYKVLKEQPTRQSGGNVKQEIISYIRIPENRTQNEFKNRNRLHINQNQFKFYLQSEKDANETSGLDFVSGGFKFQHKNKVWYIGDYTPKFGLGLTLYQGYQNTLSNQNTVFNNGFKLHTGADENRFLRGIVFEVNYSGKGKFTGFMSHRRVDGKFDSSGIYKLFSEGNHVTDSELRLKHAIQLNHTGVGYTMYKGKMTLGWLGYWTGFSKPVVMENRGFNNQMSNAFMASYFNSGIHITTEVSLDQFKYLSYMSVLRLHLGHFWYLRAYSANENKIFTNHFRNIPKSFSTPERFYGYRLESVKKKMESFFEHQISNALNTYSQKQTYRFGMTFKLKRKSILQIRSSLKVNTVDEYIQPEQTHIFRGRLSFVANQRGVWRWKQSIHVKSGSSSESGLAYAMQIEYKKIRWNIKAGCIILKQNKGAFYIYETDILSAGYVKGQFNSGEIIYLTTQYNFNKWSYYQKWRLSTKTNTSKPEWSFGLKYRFE